MEDASATMPTIATTAFKVHSTATSSTEWVSVDQEKGWSGMEHARQLMGQLAQLATVVEEFKGNNETATLSAVYQYPVVPDTHGPGVLHVNPLHGSLQLAVWVILLVIIMLLMGK